MHLMKRIGVTTVGLLTTGALLAPAALADEEGTGGSNTCTITDNGAFSSNRCRIRVRNSSTTVQINGSKIRNKVRVLSNTGGNHASFNTGGSVSVSSGNSTVNVSITNTTGGNTINP